MTFDNNNEETASLEGLDALSVPLSRLMRCGILTNAQGQIVIVHDKEIISSVQWVEYDAANDTIMIIYADGSAQDLGVKIDDKTRANLVKAKDAIFSLVKDKKAHSAFKVAFIIHN